MILPEKAPWGTQYTPDRPRYPGGWPGGRGGKFAPWAEYRRPFNALRMSTWSARGASLATRMKAAGSFYRSNPEFMLNDVSYLLGRGSVRAGSAALRGARWSGSTIKQGAMGLGRSFSSGGVARASLRMGLTASPFAVIGGIGGAAMGGAAGMFSGSPDAMGPMAALGGTLGAAAGVGAYMYGGKALKSAGRAGLTGAGILGGGLEILFGAGSKIATGAIGTMGDAVAKTSPTMVGGILGRSAAGAGLGALAGSAIGGTTGTAIFGGAIGAITGPRLSKLRGGIAGVMMNHPVAAVLGVVGMAGFARTGGRLIGKMLRQDAPSSVAQGSWNEVYGLSSNNMNTAGLGLALHYNR